MGPRLLAEELGELWDLGYECPSYKSERLALNLLISSGQWLVLILAVTYMDFLTGISFEVASGEDKIKEPLRSWLLFFRFIYWLAINYSWDFF